MTPDVIHISQPGKVVGRKLRLGELSLVGGKQLLTLTRKSVTLGNGVELSEGVPTVPGCVSISVTADAAKRLGWPHPANRTAVGPSDLPRLRTVVCSDAYGQQERLSAVRQITEVDPEQGRALLAAYSWLEAP